MAELSDFYIGTVLEATPGDATRGSKTTNIFVIPDDGWLIEIRLELDYPSKNKKIWKFGETDGAGNLIDEYSGQMNRPDIESTMFLEVSIAKATNPFAFKPLKEEDGTEIRATISTGRDLTPYNLREKMPHDADDDEFNGLLDDDTTQTPSWSFNPGQVTEDPNIEGLFYTSGYKCNTNGIGLPTVKVSRGDRIRFWCGETGPSYNVSQTMWYANSIDPYYSGSLDDPDGTSKSKTGGLNDVFYYARFTRVDPAIAIVVEAPPTTSITTTTQLKTFMGLTEDAVGAEDALESAEALIAAHIGTKTLHTTVQAEAVTTVRTRGTIEVSRAPITTFTSVTYDSGAGTVSDTSVDANSPWVVTAAGDFSRGTKFTVNYTSGWTADTFPNEIMRAVCATAELFIDGGGRGVAAEGVGDYSKTSGPGEASISIPPIARELLLKWRRPQL